MAQVRMSDHSYRPYRGTHSNQRVAGGFTGQNPYRGTVRRTPLISNFAVASDDSCTPERNLMNDSPSASWQQLLATARTVPHVVAVCNDFLDRIDARAAIELPAPCRPRPMRSGADISEYAYDLKRWTHAAQGPGRDT